MKPCEEREPSQPLICSKKYEVTKRVNIHVEKARAPTKELIWYHVKFHKQKHNLSQIVVSKRDSK